jgi:EAL domain-containing protein (putative c-di-GMP-specific phosphodiesterase class I)
MFTVAEYAHNGAVVDLLRHLGIDYAQGYAFGSPMPLRDLLKEDVHAAQC